MRRLCVSPIRKEQKRGKKKRRRNERYEHPFVVCDVISMVEFIFASAKSKWVCVCMNVVTCKTLANT